MNQIYCYGKDDYEVECDIGGDDKLIAKGRTREAALRAAVDLLTAYIQGITLDEQGNGAAGVFVRHPRNRAQ